MGYNPSPWLEAKSWQKKMLLLKKNERSSEGLSKEEQQNQKRKATNKKVGMLTSCPSWVPAPLWRETCPSVSDIGLHWHICRLVTIYKNEHYLMVPQRKLQLPITTTLPQSPLEVDSSLFHVENIMPCILIALSRTFFDTAHGAF